MDTKYLVVGGLVVLLLVVALQAYQLVSLNSKLSTLQGGVVSTNQQTYTPPQQPAQQPQELPSQVGGC